MYDSGLLSDAGLDKVDAADSPRRLVRNRRNISWYKQHSDFWNWYKYFTDSGNQEGVSTAAREHKLYKLPGNLIDLKEIKSHLKWERAVVQQTFQERNTT